jgi:YVTN family beta-propeller protein
MRVPDQARSSRLLPFLLLGLFGLAAPPAARAVAFHSTAIDITPDGQEVWVVNPDINTVSVIATQGAAENTMLAEIPVAREPWCVDIHPTNGEVWVTSNRDDRIIIIDAATRAVVDSIATGYETFGVAFSPDGTQAVVTATGSDEVSLIDVASRQITSTAKVYRRPRGIAWAPDGSRAWVSHLLTPSYFARLTVVDAATGETSEILMRQVFGTDRAGYPSAMQNISLAPAPGDSLLWIPCELINSAKGALSGIPFTFTNIFHAAVRPVNVVTGEDLNWDTYFLSEGGTPNRGYGSAATPVDGPVAVDFKDGRAYVPNMQSNDVTVLNDDILNAAEVACFPAGKAPIGVVTHPTLDRGYVANWLSRDVTVFDTASDTVVATVSSITTELLDPHVLNGKRLFFTSTGRMSFENRNSCTNCHVFGRPDARLWDLSQFGGRQLRATKDWRGAWWTAPYGWTGYFDEIQDNEWSIRGLLGGVGLIDGQPNPSLGPPNRGLSRDLDDLSAFITLQVPRPDTPYQNPDGTLTAAADSGRVLFNDPVVGCAVCHIPPLYYDGDPNADPFILHDVGTGDDPTTYGGLDTPSLCGVWDGGPYLHNNHALTIEDVLTTFNANDEHGVTSQLSPEQIGFLAEFVNSIGWPEEAPSPVAAPEQVVAAGTALDGAFPNPFRDRTSLRFQVPDATSRVRLEIYDVAGRRVATPLDRPVTRGEHLVGWSTRDAQGRPVAPGVYFARLLVNGQPSGSKKMTVVR